MIILGIDPGTKCGWAVVKDGGIRIGSGVWDLKPRRHEGGGMRYLRVRRYVEELLAGSYGIEAVAYEEVRRHMGVDAAHVYGGIVAEITAVCEKRDPKLPYRGVPVGTIKKLATGKGNANKAKMIEMARAVFGCEPKDDNEADALWCAAALDRELNG